MAAMKARTILDGQRLYTVAEFEGLPEFEERYELLDGRLVEKPLPSGKHGYIVDKLRDALKAHDPQNALGFSLQEVSVRLSANHAPTPDASYWKAQRGIEPGDSAMPLPDLAIEVHSPSDLKGKVTLETAMIKVYNLLDAGVSIVWVIYPNRKTVEVYRADQKNNYRSGPVQNLGVGQELDGEDLIPGFRMPVAKLFS